MICPVLFAYGNSVFNICNFYFVTRHVAVRGANHCENG